MYIAKPNLTGKLNTKEFSTKREAVEFLKKATGYEEMEALDWELVGKLEKVPVTKVIHFKKRTDPIYTTLDYPKVA